VTPEEFTAVQKLLQPITCPVIVELGAYRGEDSHNFERMIAAGETLLHVMVEPDWRNQAYIAQNEHRPLGSNRRLIRGAIASQPGRRHFRVSLDSRDNSRGSGSILEPTGHLEHFPTITFEDPEVVNCYTLDGIFYDEYLSKIDLLWVDIQGAEREMIMGGHDALEKTRFCFMEAEEIEMYSGQALKPELIALLEPSGWRLVQDFGFNILLENTRFDI